MDREQWLEDRKQGLGGSDIASALGLSPFRTRRELWGIKTGEIIDSVDNRFTRAGIAMEQSIAVLAAQEYGWTLRQKHIAVEHRAYPILRGNVDRLIVGERAGVECKLVDGMAFRLNDAWGDEDTDQVPPYYLLQCLLYAMILDYPLWYLVALVGGNDLKRYVIRRDPALEQLIIDGAHEFWGFVETKQPPPLDYESPTTVPLLRKLYSGTNGETIMLPPEFDHWTFAYQEFAEKEKQAEQGKSAVLAHILEYMGCASIGRLSSGDGEWRRSIVNRKGYEVAPTTYQRCTFSNKLKESQA